MCSITVRVTILILTIFVWSGLTFPPNSVVVHGVIPNNDHHSYCKDVNDHRVGSTVMDALVLCTFASATLVFSPDVVSSLLSWKWLSQRKWQL